MDKNVKNRQCSGRSMIEMLGVLAIIGVLSIGGIAGYSKAMEKWKANKIIADYNMLIRGLFEYRENIINNIKGQTGEVLINNLVSAAGIVPENWKIEGRYLADNYGNLVYPYAINDARYISEPRIVLDFNLNGLAKNENGLSVSAGFSDKLCMELFLNLVIPLHNMLMAGYVYPYNDTIRYGDRYCNQNKKCLKDLTFEDVHNICNVCDKSNRRCNITISF